MSNIILYTLSDCTFCKNLKIQMTRMGIHFEERDTESEKYTAEYNFIVESTGCDTIPVVRVGNTVYTADNDFKDFDECIALIKKLAFD